VDPPREAPQLSGRLHLTELGVMEDVVVELDE
jgi:hypothetical protein